MTIPPDSTIDHIGADDTVSVGQPQPAAPTCLDVGGGVGQWSDTLAPCALVEVGVPPTLPPAGALPAAGMPAVTVLLFAALVAGFGAVFHAGGRR